ncbi:MAG: hypothetical protein AB1442_13740 [Nitrospirota bacterium]
MGNDWIDYIGNFDEFSKIVKSLRRKTSSSLEKAIPVDHPLYNNLLASSRLKELADINDLGTLSQVEGFVLVIIYAWGQAIEKFQLSPNELGDLLLVFARYLYIAFRVHILYDTNSMKQVKKHQAAKEWVLSRKLNNAIQDINIHLSESEIIKVRETLRPQTLFSRHIKSGIEILQGELCQLLSIKPTIIPEKSQPLKTSPRLVKKTSRVDNNNSITSFLQESDVPVLPPFGSSLSLTEWLLQVFDFLYKQERYHAIGEILWNVQGYLPGCSSKSWEQLNSLFGYIKFDLFFDSRVLAIGLMTKHVLSTNRTDKITLCPTLVNLETNNLALGASSDY